MTSSLQYFPLLFTTILVCYYIHIENKLYPWYTVYHINIYSTHILYIISNSVITTLHYNVPFVSRILVLKGMFGYSDYCTTRNFHARKLLQLCGKLISCHKTFIVAHDGPKEKKLSKFKKR